MALPEKGLAKPVSEDEAGRQRAWPMAQRGEAGREGPGQWASENGVLDSKDPEASDPPDGCLYCVCLCV